MRKRFVTLCVALLSSGFAAYACDCSLPYKALKDADGKPLSAELRRKLIRDHQIKNSSLVATIEVTRMSIERRRDGEMEAIADARLLESVKGVVPKRLKIRSSGGDEGANCGRASSLFMAASQHETLTVSLYPDKKNKRMFSIGLCGLVERGGFGSAAR